MVKGKNKISTDYFAILGSRNLRDWTVRSDADLFFKVSVSPNTSH